jgi:ferredoxin
MAYVINEEKCVGCGACVAVCPVEAISQNGDKYKIDANTCADCGACAGECPSEAISQA